MTIMGSIGIEQSSGEKGPIWQAPAFKYTGSLDQFKKVANTPCIGTTFVDVDLAEWLRAPNSDDMLRDLSLIREHPNLEVFDCRKRMLINFILAITQWLSAVSSSSAGRRTLTTPPERALPSVEPPHWQPQNPWLLPPLLTRYARRRSRDGESESAAKWSFKATELTIF